MRDFSTQSATIQASNSAGQKAKNSNPSEVICRAAATATTVNTISSAVNVSKRRALKRPVLCPVSRRSIAYLPAFAAQGSTR